MTTVCDFPGESNGKASVYNAGDPGSSLGWEDPLEKEMAIHSSTIAWRIPWTEEPGRLQSMGSQRVGHDGATSVSQSVVLCNRGTGRVSPALASASRGFL